MTASVVLDLSMATLQANVVGTIGIQLSDAAGIENFIGGSGNDTVTANTRPNVLQGAGNDTYKFAGTTNLGNDTVNESGALESDTLDF